MKSGFSTPNLSNLIKIANYFNCSTDYLLGRTSVPTVINEHDTKSIELETLIYQFERLSSSNKENLLNYLSFLYANTLKE